VGFLCACSSLWSHEAAIPLIESYHGVFSSLSGDPYLLARAEKLFARFMAELVQSSLAHENGTRLDDVKGYAIVSEKRVVIVKDVGIALAVLFAFNAVLLLVISRQSHPCIRRLNLNFDPSSIIYIAKLISTQDIDLDTWQIMFLTPPKAMSSSLVSKVYRTSFSRLWETLSKENRRVTTLIYIFPR